MATKSESPPIWEDGFTSFELGINSGEQPFLLPANQLSFLINGTVRGHLATHRPPWRIAALKFATTNWQTGLNPANFQGACYYKPDAGPESLICQIGGLLFQCTPDNGNNIAITDVSIPGDHNPASPTQAWLWQAERWVIVNDGQSIPIFFDGATSRRSESTQRILGALAGISFTAPAVGSTVSILVNPGFSGQYGESFIVQTTNGSSVAMGTYQIVPSSPFSNADVNIFFDSATTHPTGTQVVIDPNIMGMQSATVPFANHGQTFPGGGTAITLELTRNYSFAMGEQLSLFGISWTVTSFSGKFVTIQNNSTITIPAGIVAGQKIFFAGTSYPIQVVGTLAQTMTVPPPSSFTSIILNVPYTGPGGQVVYIGNGQYTINPLSIPPVASPFLALNINDVPGNTPVSTTENLFSIPELPPGRMGVYQMGRVWECLTDGRSYIGGDLVGTSSGTTQYAFRDAVLKTTQNLFLASGGFFLVPGNIGNIQAMQFAATLDSSLGQGPLQIFTPSVVFSCNAPVAATDWQNMVNPIQTESLIGGGALSQNATIPANGDTIFRSIDGVRSLILARREFNTWGNVPISHEMDRVIVQDDTSLLQFGSAAITQNRMLMTSKPTGFSGGIFHQGLMALNFEPLASIAGKEPAVWDGLWTGLNVLQIIQGSFSNVQRCFAFTYNVALSQIEIYELLADGAAISDNNGVSDIPITWTLETSCLFTKVKNKAQFDLVKLMEGELYVGDVAGTVSFDVKYRCQFDPCWHDWYAFSICAGEGTSASTQMQNRTTLGIGQPPIDSFDATNNRPTYVGESFQLRIQVTGHCLIYGIRVKGSWEPRAYLKKPVKEDPDCTLLSCVNEPDYATYRLDNFPPVGQSFTNDAVFYNAQCPGGTTLTFTGSLPAWITIDFTTGLITGAAGTFSGGSLSGVNSQAQLALNNWVLQNQASGALVCLNICVSGVTTISNNCYAITGYFDGMIPVTAGGLHSPNWDGTFKFFHLGSWYGGNGNVAIQGFVVCIARLTLQCDVDNNPSWVISIQGFSDDWWEGTKVGGQTPVGAYSQTGGTDAGPASVSVESIPGATTDGDMFCAT